MPYKIIFIDDVLKREIVRKFLDSCSEQLATKILRQLKYLQEFGINKANPNLKKLTNSPFWEIRILGKQNIRVFCASYRSSQTIVVHIFNKKTTKTPHQEIRKARQLLIEALDK